MLYLGLCLSLYLYRVCVGVQYHLVRRHGRTTYVVHGFHRHDNLEKDTGAATSAVEVQSRKDGFADQHHLTPFLRDSLHIRILPAVAESAGVSYELGGRGVRGCTVLSAGVLCGEGEEGVCWSGGLCEEGGVRGGQ